MFKNKTITITLRWSYRVIRSVSFFANTVLARKPIVHNLLTWKKQTKYKYNGKFAFLSKRIPLDLVEYGLTTMFTSSV